MWRSFRYDENEDTIDSYILKVKQVASLLNYGEPEILELFKNTLPSNLYWILFPINNLREAIDTAKRVMNKEKLYKQLTGQTSNISPFMKYRDDTHSGQQKMLNPQDLEGLVDLVGFVDLVDLVDSVDPVDLAGFVGLVSFVDLVDFVGLVGFVADILEQVVEDVDLVYLVATQAIGLVYVVGYVHSVLGYNL